VYISEHTFTVQSVSKREGSDNLETQFTFFYQFIAYTFNDNSYMTAMRIYSNAIVKREHKK
jgi:hypothetical protein